MFQYLIYFCCLLLSFSSLFFFCLYFFCVFLFVCMRVNRSSAPLQPQLLAHLHTYRLTDRQTKRLRALQPQREHRERERHRESGRNKQKIKYTPRPPLPPSLSLPACYLATLLLTKNPTNSQTSQPNNLYIYINLYQFIFINLYSITQTFIQTICLLKAPQVKQIYIYI